MKQIAVIGGGLAGLVNAILLSRNGFQVTLYEKKQYPFHKVCGEYISNEVRPFLKREKLLPQRLELPEISRFQFTSIKGRSLELNLDLGGFGISRYYFDDFLKDKAIEAGVEIRERCSVQNLQFIEDRFSIQLATGQTEFFQLVIGAYGKKSNLDNQLGRSFIQGRSPFIGVKYHIKTDFPENQISLHNFEGGYCGISAIENDKYNLCYLGSRDLLRRSGSIPAYESEFVKENPYLTQIFDNSDFLFDRPEVINEFSFKPKKPVENNVLMSGDSAGLITPLCGNGMAMAIHSAFLLSGIIAEHHKGQVFERTSIERKYTKAWNTLFRKRLWVGRKTQALFGSRITSELSAIFMKQVPILGKLIMKNSHGEPF